MTGTIPFLTAEGAEAQRSAEGRGRCRPIATLPSSLALLEDRQATKRADAFPPRTSAPLRPRRFNGVALCFAMMLVGCTEGSSVQKMAEAFQNGTTTPDELPKLINAELPFRYPAPLYARRVQGNVTLRIIIDRNGLVHKDSTRVEEPSGYPALDSAAVKGSAALRFVPAKLHGEPMPVTVLFPVYFRHPEARALPGDTILNKRGPTP